MIPDFDVENVRQLLASALGVNVDSRAGRMSAELTTGEVTDLSVSDVEEILNTLHSYDLDGEAAIYTSTDLEVLVREEAGLWSPGFQRRGSWPLEVADTDLGLTYRLGPLSDHFLLYVASRVSSFSPDARLLWRRRLALRRRPGAQQELLEAEREDEPKFTLLTALSYAMPRLHSLRVTSDKDVSHRQLQQAADAFSFQIAYNLDTAFVAISVD